MPAPKKERPPPEQLRPQVDEIMANWRSHPDFAHLFDSLLKVNGVSNVTFVSEYVQATGSDISETTIFKIRQGIQQPTYRFVADLADHALLSLDPERVTPARDGVTAGDQRIALFAAAGLIEVTPESIGEWNQEVLAGWQRRCRGGPGHESPTWQELMYKLLDFQLQGERMHLPDVADAISSQPESNHPISPKRLKELLNGTYVSTREERLGLARFVGLDAARIDLIERAMDDGTLSLQHRRTHSAFSGLLGEFLERLRAGGINQTQLSLRCKPPGVVEPLAQTSISAWKNGRAMPTLSSLRALVHGLEQCRPAVAITPEEIGSLVSAAGFSPEDLSATTHDVVARIDGSTRLKPLLAALRNAVDLDVPMSAVEGLGGQGVAARSGVQLKEWENESLEGSPSLSQVTDLLSRFNRLLRDKGREELSAEEVQRVMEVAQRHRQYGLVHGFQKRAHEHRPRTPRRTITPDFDTGPSR